MEDETIAEKRNIRNPVDENAALLKQNQELDRAIKIANKSLENINASLQGAEGQYVTRTKEIAAMETRLAENESVIAESDRIRRGNEAIIEAQTAEMKRNSDDVHTLQNNKTVLQADISSLEETKTEREEAERVRVTDLIKNETEGLRTKIDASNEELVITTKKIATLEKQKKELETEVNKLSASRESIASEIVRLKVEKDSITKENDDHSKELKDLQDEIAGLTPQRNALRDAVKDLTTKSDALTSSIEDKKQGIKELEEQTAAKIAEYKVEENRLFAIAERELQVNQREDFIKEKYRLAGITYR
jgi:cancer susceptibility candidate protein 1